MPTTVNGIGTHYYGKKNEDVRMGCCEACGAQTELHSYDTGLYFVFVFIPIFPLGRKRIVDYCPHCRRHRAVPLEQYNELVAQALRTEEEDAENRPTNHDARPASSAADVYDPFATKPPSNFLDKLHTKSGRLILLVGIALATLLGITLYGWYETTHQPIFIINGLNRPIRVSIDEGNAKSINARSYLEMVLPEGKHRAIAKGKDGVEETIDFEVKNTLSQRFLDDSTFVLNIAKAGALILRDVKYSENPEALGPPAYRIYHNRDFFVFRDVDYAFCEPPDEIQLESGSTETRRHLTMLQGEPLDAIMFFLHGASPEDLLVYLERQLTFYPNDEKLLGVYATVAERKNEAGRCRDYLEKGLARRPVAVEWHRAYQEMEERQGQVEELLARYDAMLKKAPDDSMLLYLRGRITPEGDEAEKYFDKAIEANGDNAYPHLAKGYRLAALGRFEDARPLVDKAYENNPQGMSISTLYYEVHLALRDFDAVEQMLATSTNDLFEVLKHKNRLRILVAKGDLDAAKACHEQFVAAFASPLPLSPMELRSRYTLEYLLGNMDEAAAAAEQIQRHGEDHRILWETRLEQGKPDEAESLTPLLSTGISGEDALMMRFAWKAAGDNEAAKRWYETALDKLSQGSAEERQAGQLLKQGPQATMKDVNNLIDSREHLIVFLTALADDCPPLREELIARVEKLNTIDVFPHRFLKQTLRRIRREK